MPATQDAEHLRLLSLFHYVYAAIIAFYSMFGMIYVVMGLLITAMPFVVDEAPHSTTRPNSKSDRQQLTADDGRSNDNNLSTENKPSAEERGPAKDQPVKVKENTGKKSDDDSTETNSPEIPRHERNRPPPRFLSAFGLMFACIGAGILLIGLTYALVAILAGRCIGRRKHRVFCMTLAVLNCMNLSMGTVLGVFTLIVLVRPSVKQRFDAQAIPDAKPTSG